MAQKIPFFELFHTLNLPWELRVALDGSYLTQVEIHREIRELTMELTTQKELGESLAALEQAVAEAYGLKAVHTRLKVAAPAQESGGNKNSEEVILGGAIKGAVQPMTGLNPKMGNVVVAGKVFFADMYETRRPGVF